MKAIDYFRRAQTDRQFRRERLEDLRYLRTVSLGLLVFMGVIALGGMICIAWDEGWRTGLLGAGQFGLSGILLTAWNYSRQTTLIAALEAMDLPSEVPFAPLPDAGAAQGFALREKSR